MVAFDEDVGVVMAVEVGSVDREVVEVSQSVVKLIVEGPAASTTLIDTVEILVVSLVTVLRTVDAGKVLAGCVNWTVTVERISVVGVTVFVGPVTVSVTSIVVAAAGSEGETVAVESELPSTATTEYRLSRKAFRGWEGREVMRNGRDDRRRSWDGRSKRIFDR